MIFLYNHIRTRNDSNGNPRRLFHVFQLNPAPPDRSLYPVAVVEEGYQGTDALTGLFPGALVPMGTYDVTPTEYNQIKRSAKAQGIYHG